jgi:hypothetical protein
LKGKDSSLSFHAHNNDAKFFSPLVTSSAGVLAEKYRITVLISFSALGWGVEVSYFDDVKASSNGREVCRF